MVLLWFCLAVLICRSAGTQWVEHTGSCYWLHDTDTSKEEAEVTCAGLHSIVTELESPGEFLNVNDVLRDVAANAWVGLSKDTETGTFTWTKNGGEAESAMWKTGEPNNSGNCVRLVRYYLVSATNTVDLGQHYLADHLCTTTYRPFCEKPSSPAASYSKKVLTLPAELCHIEEVITSGRIECAQLCALRSTSCYVYGYEDSSGKCSFHRLLDNCANVTILKPGVVFYRISRSC